jgi:hypothetical protein
MFPNMSFNELASAAINKEGSMKACAEVEEEDHAWILRKWWV